MKDILLLKNQRFIAEKINLNSKHRPNEEMEVVVVDSEHGPN